MESSMLFEVLLAGINILLGFVLASVWQAVKDLQKADATLADKVASIEVLVAGQYIKRDYFEAKLEALFGKLDHMEAKFDLKLDKALNGKPVI
jgi:hypothetical protein